KPPLVDRSVRFRRRRRWFGLLGRPFFSLWPALLFLAPNSAFAALSCPARGPLAALDQLPHNAPGVRRMVPDPAFALDQERHTRRRPRAAFVPQRFGPTLQCALDPAQLGCTQLRLAPGMPGSVQRPQSRKARAGLAFVRHGRSFLVHANSRRPMEGWPDTHVTQAFEEDGMEGAARLPCPRANMKVRGLAGNC